MMHCTMDDLGALRDGEASVWARQHITTCRTCQAELEALYQRVAQLKALPALRPARDRWPMIHNVLRAERTKRRRTWSTWGGLAAAAALTGILLVPRAGQHGTLYAELSQAKQQSATLEDSLQRYDVEDRVLSGRAAAIVADLEDRISVIDGNLSRAGSNAEAQEAELVRLWQERVGLMRELVSARATRARYVGL
jgi:hypothetical protein